MQSAGMQADKQHAAESLNTGIGIIQEARDKDQVGLQPETPEISILEQCRHKNHTGRLQRRLREMTDA